MSEPISHAQKQFLQKKRRSLFLIRISRIFLLVFFLALWEIASRTNMIDAFIFSSPSLIVQTTCNMFQDHSLFLHLRITFSETLASFFFVCTLGVGTAVLLWCMPFLAQILELWLIILNSLPKSALAPLLIVWLGANQTTIIVSGISVAVFGSVLNLYTGFSETDTDKLKLIRTMGGRKYHELTKVVLPSSIPLILSTMKVNIGLCLVGVIIGEFIGAREGLGYLIIYGSQTFKLSWVLMSICLLCFMALFLYEFITLLERIYLGRKKLSSR